MTVRAYMTKMLIVEDNKNFRQELKYLVASRFPHLNIEEALDEKEALEKISSFLPDFIFTDINLSGGSGLELTSKIKRTYSNIIIIIISSYDLPEYRNAAKQSGADYFVSKGGSSSVEILALVESILATLDSKD
jgi:DNA-binding NarL/FixJ family response regulator